jgi:hypothetical protein
MENCGCARVHVPEAFDRLVVAVRHERHFSDLSSDIQGQRIVLRGRL